MKIHANRREFIQGFGAGLAGLALAPRRIFGATVPPVTLNLGRGTVIRFITPAPVLWSGECISEPAFDPEGNARVNGLTLKRSIEEIDGGYRIKLSITNSRDKEIALKALIPVQVPGQENMLVAGTAITAWRIFRMARQKNDIPGPFRPTQWDDAARDAAFDSTEGTRGAGEERPSTLYHSDPGFVVMPDGKPASTDLFIGFDGQTEHLNDVAIQLDNKLTRLEKLTATAEFNGVIVPPGATRETHDLYIQTGKGYYALLGAHVERIERRYGARFAGLRNIFCTWYFYGPDIVAGDLRKDLAELKRRPVKFDLFQIDYGWSGLRYGDWNADPKRFPRGMQEMAVEIRAAGLVPGIWAAPFLVSPGAEVLKRYSDLLLKDRDGQYVKFGRNAYVVDPTAPSAEAFLTDLCRKLTGWGYCYLKFDFLRALVNGKDAVFHDRSMDHAQAYRHGMEILRKAVGNDVLIGGWGGLYEANAGLVNINRSGSDVRGYWDPDGYGDYRTRYPVRMRQTFARIFYNGKLWTSDSGALQLRRRTKPWRHAKLWLSMGIFTDEEAFSMVVYRFLDGGTVQVSEKLDELSQDRYDLYKMVIPTYAPVAKWFRGWKDYLPEYFVSHFASHDGLPPWAMVSLCNWNGNACKELAFRISAVPDLPKADRYAAFEFKTQKFLGVFQPADTIRLDLARHAARVIRLTPIRGDGICLIGTDLNMSCGMEIAHINGEKALLRKELREFPCKFTFLRWKNGATSIDRVDYQPGR